MQSSFLTSEGSLHDDYPTGGYGQKENEESSDRRCGK